MATDLDVRRHNESLLEELKEGDMIEMPRAKGIYSHWAVYIGNKMVIHLSSDPKSTLSANSSHLNVFSICGVKSMNAYVMEGYLIDVAANSKAIKNNDKDSYEGIVPLKPDDIVERARSQLGVRGYNLLWHNCEYFASWCRYGHGWSEQTIKGLRELGLIVAALLDGVAGVEDGKALADEEEEKN